MLFVSQKLTTVVPDFNREPLTQQNFADLCVREKIIVVHDSMPLLKAFTCRMFGQTYIFVDKDLDPVESLFLSFHELVHHFLHTHRSAIQYYHMIRPRKEETEADIGALLCLYPTRLLAEFEPQSRFEAELFCERLKIYDSFGQ